MKLNFILIPLAILGLSTLGCKEKINSKTTSTWFTPTEKKVSLKEAHKLCKDNGARVPTIDELRTVITDCKGVVGDYDSNTVNTSYQSCYKRKGFSSKFLYWSATTYNGLEYLGWSVILFSGTLHPNAKNVNIRVQCIRDKE